MKTLLFFLGLAALPLLGLAWFTRRTAARIVQYLPAKGRFVDVPGGRLHVLESGPENAPAVLLVHGLGGQMSHFDYGLAEQLARSFRVVVVDRPGSGHSLRDELTSADVSTQAAALALLIDKLALGRPTVVGHSLGGAIALALAVEHPASVGALALVAPLTHAPETAPQVFKALTIETRWVRKLFAWTLATPGAIVGSKKVLAAVFAPEKAPADFAVKGGGLHSLRPSQFLAASSDLQAIPLRMPLVQGRYAELALPLSVLYARQDAILDWRENGQALVDKVPGARLELVDGGHMLPVTQPQVVADFVERAARAAAPQQRAG
ncbi:alpha/beta fold hydrolase [Massilia sp. IC2-278]|uniref:alpha/beta fold hydrolase n=1 Tax=Massilia sp. IC2-278 TaxID=2887200 RepID=UPI001E407C7C|nr:alpha/beta fold hydrolase [Massilia sp. IC2-278]MCC2959636.1 alpha/beta fold hydrolase [Massilia sp. IC2-278]